MTSCSKVTLFLIRAAIFYSIFLGALPFKFNVAQHKLETSKWTLIYSLFINLLVFGIILCYVPAVMVNNTNKVFIGTTSLAGIVQILHVSLCVISLIVMLLKHWIGQKNLVNIIAEGLEVRNSYSHLSSKLFFGNIFLQRYVIARISISLGQMGCNLYMLFGMQENTPFWFFMMIFFLQNVMMAIEAQYYFGILYTCCYSDQLKNDLQKMYRQVGAAAATQPCRLAEKVDLIASTHCKLMRLGRTLTKFYQLQIILVLFNLLASVVFSGFISHVLVLGNVMNLSFQSVYLFPLYAVLSLLSFMLNIYVCQRKINLSRDIRQSLKDFTQIEYLESQLSKSVRSNFFDWSYW